MIQTDKKVLDAACASRMMWFDKKNPLALYADCREMHEELIWTSRDGKEKKYCTIEPDVIADFTELPFEDNTFYHVVFDPPHLTSLSETAWLAKKYGCLPKEGWENIIRKGFSECMRVLKPNGTLIFKWNETDIPVKTIIEVIGAAPLYGHKSGRQSKTHWMAFIKTEAEYDNKS